MNINTHQEENYLHVLLEGKFDENNWNLFSNTLNDADNPQIWIILEFSDEITYLTSELSMSLAELHEQCIEENGLLVVVSKLDSIVNQLEELNMMVIPSLDEAIDYIYIEQLERDLGLE